ncbi:hypothetical protein GCM10010413_49990 [Promicromonospora sukumoe]|uniref:Uncharacterized protein n=1 Tax=Promicromonospora sukumoe TaxID=88382 RepID=A0A7W3PCD7_9MICO|nr:hypothetical protein [Promicromonospora sukumoe]MBA8806369.1 hypothetical protein [Promicromonospora sukumoe]
MADLLIAVAEGNAQFDADQVAAAIVRRWPSADVVSVDGPELSDLAQLMSTQVTINDGQRAATVEFHTSAKAIDAEGDDDLAAEFISLLTRTVPVPEDAIVVMNWADDIVALRPNMTPEDVHALRG